MCGIAGYWQPEAATSGRVVLENMVRLLAHRGPDSNGIWLDRNDGVGLGHARLAIVDLTQEGAQPMRSRCGRYIVTFNGEIYNHLDLRRTLGAATWRGHSDTETLLACFARYGVVNTLPRLVGMFAFAVWDTETRSLTLARDRFGEKPLYHGEMADGTFAFASELRALRSHPRWRGEIDREALGLLLRHNCIPAPWSIYQGVSKLEAGSWLTLHAGGARSSGRYWDVVEIARQGLAAPLVLSDTEATDRLEALLLNSVRGQLLADVPLGAFLSGGVDSSTIVALMQQVSDRPVRTFSIGFSAAGYDEAEHAKAVARHLGTEHSELYVGESEALEVVPKLPELYDEPFADASQIPTFLVAQMARRGVKVALSGDGGDELFAGYNRHLLADRWWPRLRRVPLPLRRGLARGALALRPGMWDRLSRRAALGDRMHKFASKVLPSDSPRAMYAALAAAGWCDAPGLIPGRAEVRPIEDERLGNFSAAPAEQMALADQIGYLTDDILVKVDRAAMAVGLETRVPLLDHRVVAFAWQIPLKQKIRAGRTKWLLREVLQRHVPRELIERPKQGFAVPLEQWLRGPLRHWAESLLTRKRLEQEGHFDADAIRRKWREHLAGRRNWQQDLWSVLMFQAWLERWRA